jgi:hypothetical protein
MATKKAVRQVEVDLEELAPRDLVNDPAYLRALLRGTWRLLPEDVSKVFAGDPEDAQVLAQLVEDVLETEIERGYVEAPEVEEEDDDLDTDDLDPDDDDGEDGDGDEDDSDD